MKFLKKSGCAWLLLMLFNSLPVMAVEAVAGSIEVPSGDQWFAKGQTKRAIIAWNKELSGLNNIRQKSLWLQKIAAAYQAVGEYEAALTAGQKALALSQQGEYPKLHYRVQASLASIHVSLGQMSQARRLFEQSLSQAKTHQDGVTQAEILYEFANIAQKQKYTLKAQDYYEQSRQLAQTHKLRDLLLRIDLNLSVLALRSRDRPAFQKHVSRAVDGLTKIESAHKRKYQLRLGEILVSGADFKGEQSLKTVGLAYEILLAAQQHAESTADDRAQSYALGLMAALYNKNGRPADAKDLLQRAAFFAQAANAEDLLYRWHWLLGRLASNTGDGNRALEYYRLAQTSYKKINPLQTWTTLHGRDTAVGFHYELAQTLLSLSDKAQPDEKNAFLKETVDSIEGLKSAELQDYFKDSCVANTQSDGVEIAQQLKKEHALVLYPILFEDRLELLVNDGGSYQRYTSRVTAADIRTTVLDLRQQLEKRRSRSYLKPAKQLYEWIISPLGETLASTSPQTLVIIPDLGLRSVPFGVLHDGKRFLIENLAVVSSPGLNLTAAPSGERQGTQALLSGITESVQGYPVLNHVQTELAGIQSVFDAEVLVDGDFRKANLRRKLTGKAFTVAHVATHGEFSGNVQESFLLAYDGKISVDELSQYVGANRFRPQPIDLLTLSACSTAEGDEKAALGLAGITIKAGARSALATLWPVNDMATSELMTNFYKNLQDAGVNKAQALRQAQTQMLQDKRYRHPGFWSPFVLIGNWN